MADLSGSILIVIGISGLTFVVICAFFILIFWQEAREFTENPMLTESATKTKVALPGENEPSSSVSGSLEVPKSGIYTKNKGGRKMGRSVGTGSGSSGEMSQCSSSSTVTLEMAIAEDSGLSETIPRCSGCHGRNGTGSEIRETVTRDCGHFNPGFSIV